MTVSWQGWLSLKRAKVLGRCVPHPWGVVTCHTHLMLLRNILIHVPDTPSGFKELSDSQKTQETAGSEERHVLYLPSMMP